MDNEALPVASWRAWWAAEAHSLSSDEVVATAARQGFVLRARDLDEFGVSRGRRRWAVQTSRWTSVCHGVIAPIDIGRDLPAVGGAFVRARRLHALAGAAAVLLHPEDAMSGRTAAIVHGLPTMGVPDVPVINARDETGMGRRPRVHLLTGTLNDWQLSSWYGADTADVGRALTDLGRTNRRDAIMAADAALREGLVTHDDIARALLLAYKWPGVKQACEVLALADGRAESPLESVTRLAIHDAGLPAPELQVWIGGDRVDFFWPHRRLVLEADGRAKYDSEERWAEKRREQRLRRHPWVDRVERVTWEDVVRDWPTTQRMLADALT